MCRYTQKRKAGMKKTSELLKTLTDTRLTLESETDLTPEQVDDLLIVLDRKWTDAEAIGFASDQSG